MIFCITIILTFFLAWSSSNAAPLSAQSVTVFSPRITSPKAAILWPRGSIHNVTWDTSNIPREKHGSTGMLMIGHYANNSENLDIDHPLATYFSIDKGWVGVTIPQNLPCRDDYFVVLFGDSGNRSPKFRVCKT